MGVEKKIASKLLEVTTSEKMYKVSAVSALSISRAALFIQPSSYLILPSPLAQIGDHVGCAMAGITADANILIDMSRLNAQRYELQYRITSPPAAVPILLMPQQVS